MAKRFYEKDGNLSRYKDKTVAIVGYGSQGHAHVLNMRDSGVKEIAVALRPGSPSAKKAEAEGVKPDDIIQRLIEVIPSAEEETSARGKLPEVFRSADAG